MTAAKDALVEECRELMQEGFVPGSNLLSHPRALGLIEAAIAAIEDSVPDRFEHEGKTYRLRVKFCCLDVGVHVDLASATPLLRVETEGLRWCGYRPGH